MTLVSRGEYPWGKKLQLNPTDLTHSTPVMWWKGLGCMDGVGFVECVGLLFVIGDKAPIYMPVICCDGCEIYGILSVPQAIVSSHPVEVA